LATALKLTLDSLLAKENAQAKVEILGFPVAVTIREWPVLSWPPASLQGRQLRPLLWAPDSHYDNHSAREITVGGKKKQVSIVKEKQSSESTLSEKLFK
jgi:hypothetical protein